MMSSAALAIVLWRGGIITMEGVIMIGTLSVFMNYALNMLEPIQGIIGSISALIAIQVNIERFTKLLETQSDVADSPEVIAKYGDTFHPKKENWEPLHGDVEFKDVSFQYPDGNEMVLEHFDLKVPQGTNVAIVGETGAGKSTLVNLVCRFFEPTSGQVLIDGRDARERSQLWLHSNIGYVLQTPHLFSGSVRDNLKYGNPDATDEDIWKALELVDAVSVVNKMEKGLGF
jgi:ATP-binding cassette subfamily B protein